MKSVIYSDLQPLLYVASLPLPPSTEDHPIVSLRCSLPSRYLDQKV